MQDPGNTLRSYRKDSIFVFLAVDLGSGKSIDNPTASVYEMRTNFFPDTIIEVGRQAVPAQGKIPMGNSKDNGPPKGQGTGKDSWVDFRREVSQVPQDKRHHPRLEFHCPARLQGIKSVCRVTDMSMGGVFLEVESPPPLEVGQTLTLVLKLPTEYEPIKLTVQVANVRKRGVGLKFVKLNPRSQQTIRFCFDTFKDTIPLR